MSEQFSNLASPFRIGQGYDIHRLAALPPRGEGRPLRIGGVAITECVTTGPLGRTDADVLLHAVIEALQGAIGEPGMGSIFAEGDPRCRSTDSVLYLAEAMTRIRSIGWVLANLDATVVLERPRLAKYRTEIIEKLATLLEVPIANVNVKFKTHDGVDAVGREEALEAMSVVLLWKQS